MSVNPEESGQIQSELWDVRQHIPHRLSGGKDRAVRDGVNASMPPPRRLASMSAQIFDRGYVKMKE